MMLYEVTTLTVFDYEFHCVHVQLCKNKLQSGKIHVNLTV